MSKLTKSYLKKLKLRLISIYNWQDFINLVKSGRISILGITSASDIGAVGMCFYVVWQLDNQSYASYLSDSIKNRLEEL